MTIEEVPPGGIPDWLKQHIRLQSLGKPSNDSNRHGRILIIYPTEKSKRQALSSTDLRGAIDRTLHHTMDSLISSLIADLRLPRVISNQGPLSAIIHTECQKESSRLGFPMINPLPEMKWGKGKTEALANLHHHLSRELVAERWEGPGIPTFRRVITRLEEKLRFTHPDMVCERIIDALEDGRIPFTISDIDGIIMLDHSPSMYKSHTQILLSLSKIRPIHQLTYPGNFRIGHHGHMLLDQHPIRVPDGLPDWVPSQRTHLRGPTTSVNRILLDREAHSFEATARIVANRLSREESEIIIVDPALENNRRKWEQILGDIGITIDRGWAKPSSHSIGHWLLFLAKLGHGADAFSLSSLRSLSLQTSIVPFGELAEHPFDPEISCLADSELLTKMARNEHVLGGPGALSKWVETLSRPPKHERDGPRKEAAQWWLMSLAASIRPLLREPDRKLVANLTEVVGCHSGAKLPLPDAPQDGDEWLQRTLSLIDIPAHMDRFSGRGLSPAAVIEALSKERDTLRAMQRQSGHAPPKLGWDWVEELHFIADQTKARTGGSNFTCGISVLTPDEALGCSADLVVLSNLSSSSWELRVPKVPFVGEDERHALGILRPDATIRNARHNLLHLLNCSSEAFVLDPTADETSPPAAPIREWAEDFEARGSDSQTYETSEWTYSPRRLRQVDGLRIRQGKPPNQSPINPSAVSIPLDQILQRDRERRQPFMPSNDGYLPEENIQHLLSIEKFKLHGKAPPGIENPRNNVRWPVVGATINGKRTPSIDPRPFSPMATGVRVSDSRNGHSGETAQEIPVWSPTRLQTWSRCPRMGWLKRELGAEREDLQSEDIDNRTYGELLHSVHHDIVTQVLGFGTSEERAHDGGKGHISVQRSGLDQTEIMRIALESLDSLAPWLERTDAVSTQRLRSLTGMDRNEWNSWIADPKPILPRGRIGGLVTAELEIGDSAPISIEWRVRKGALDYIQINPTPEILERNESDPIRVRGWIDRVDVLPMDLDSQVWVDNEGSETVAPIRIKGSGWKPKRLIAIRDLKTSETNSQRNRHYQGLLEELQLAVYARAWEEAHPGDLVVATGISVIGPKSNHFLEVSQMLESSQSGINIGTKTTVTSYLHRFADEDEDADSDHFRAWLAQRLSVAMGVANNAKKGKVTPTPSSRVCSYCPVGEFCDVRMGGSF